MGYEIVRYSPDLRPAVLALLRHAWSPDPALNAACFAWKFEQNPYLDRPLIHLVMFDGQVVAMRALHGARWLRESGARPIPILSTGDFVVDPAHRGRHLFGRLLKAAATDARALGYRHLLNLSASPATYLQSVRAGWYDLGALATLQRACLRMRLMRRTYQLLARRRLLARIPRRLLAFGAERRHQGDEVADRRFRKLERAVGAGELPGVSIGREPRPTAMAELLAGMPATGQIQHARDADYLAWRFRNPLAVYRFLYRHTPGLKACLVLGTSTDPQQERVRVVLRAATDPAQGASLMRCVIERAGFADLRLWSASLPPGERLDLLAQGFQPVAPEAGARYRHAVLAFDLDPDAGEPLPPIDRWQLSMIDSDKS